MSTERIYPASDVTTNWNGWSAPPHWSRVDDAYGSETEADGGLAGDNNSVEEFTMANVSVMGASDTATGIGIYIWSKSESSTESIDVQYSIDNGSNWSSVVNVVVNQTSYAYGIASWSGLSLTQSQINAMNIRLTCPNKNVDWVYTSAVSVLVTYTAGGGNFFRELEKNFGVFDVLFKKIVRGNENKK